MKRGPENAEKISTIRMAKKTKKNIWKRVAEILSAPKRSEVSVNLGKIEKIAKEGEVIVVPGKVLGTGKVSKKLSIVAFGYSRSAIEKLKGGGCTVHYIKDYMGKDVKNARIVK